MVKLRTAASAQPLARDRPHRGGPSAPQERRRPARAVQSSGARCRCVSEPTQSGRRQLRTRATDGSFTATRANRTRHRRHAPMQRDNERASEECARAGPPSRGARARHKRPRRLNSSLARTSAEARASRAEERTMACLMRRAGSLAVHSRRARSLTTPRARQCRALRHAPERQSTLSFMACIIPWGEPAVVAGMHGGDGDRRAGRPAPGSRRGRSSGSVRNCSDRKSTNIGAARNSQSEST